jgi:hypothetical protein
LDFHRDLDDRLAAVRLCVIDVRSSLDRCHEPHAWADFELVFGGAVVKAVPHGLKADFSNANHLEITAVGVDRGATLRQSPASASHRRTPGTTSWRPATSTPSRTTTTAWPVS